MMVREPLEIAGASAERELDVLVGEYEENRKAIDRREIYYTQERLRRLGEENSDNRVGELAHLYVAKIYYQVEDYHDCIRTVDDFLRDYPRSEWRAAAENLRRRSEEEVARYRDWRSNLSTQVVGSGDDDGDDDDEEDDEE